MNIIYTLNLPAVILDGRRQVTGKNLGSIVVKGRRRILIGVTGNGENLPADKTQRMGDHRHHVAVLLYIFRQGVSHQTPAADIAHAGDIGKKVVGHAFSP